jgi:hypothetical protein
MKKLSLLLLAFAFLAGCAQSPEEVSTVQDVTQEEVVVEDSQEVEETESDAFKPAMEAGQFENEELSFALYYEYALAVTEVSENLVEVVEKDNPKALASVEWYSDGEKDYFNYLSSLSRGASWEVYEFSESESDLREVLDVKVLGGKTYAITWKESVGSDFVIVQFDDADTKSNRVAGAILQTVRMK